MMSRRRWLVGWGLLASTYLCLAVIRVAAHADWDGALVYVGAAAVTFGFAAAVIPWVLPRRREGGGGGPSPGEGGDEPPPPWWPDFEREFWGHLRGSGRSQRERESARR